MDELNYRVLVSVSVNQRPEAHIRPLFLGEDQESRRPQRDPLKMKKFEETDLNASLFLKVSLIGKVSAVLSFCWVIIVS